MAAITVVILGQKGGTRKSTIGRALAVAYSRSGWKVLLVDMDPKQATAISWNLRRQARNQLPAVEMALHSTTSAALAAGNGYDLVIIDTKGFASKETAELAQAADLVLIPSATGLDDLEPSVTLAMVLAQEHGIAANKILFPLTNPGKSEIEAAEAAIYLGKAGFQATPGFISMMTCFSKAHDQGRSVIEVAAPGPKRQANNWISGIIAHIDQIAA